MHPAHPAFVVERRQSLRHAVAGVLGLATVGWAQATPASATEMERALEKLLRDKPELVREALRALEQRDADARLISDRALLRDEASALYTEGGATVLGNPTGDVTLVEFLDYRCGYCRHLHGDITALIQADPQLRVLVKHLPILGPDSVTAARLVLAAGQGPAARRLHQRLMTGTPLNVSSLHTLQQASPAAAIDPGRVERGLAEVRQLAERLHIDGTPALLVGDQFIRGAVERAPLLAAIEAARQTSVQPDQPRAKRS